MKYRVVRMVEGRMVATDYAKRIELLDAMRAEGITQNGVQFGRQLREQLRGEPTFDGLSGPCWGGWRDGDYDRNGAADDEYVVRYEDWPSYERLSA